MTSCGLTAMYGKIFQTFLSCVLQFITGKDFTENTPGYVKNPPLADKAHCIAIVIDANKAMIMKEAMWTKLRSLRQGLISRSKYDHCLLFWHLPQLLPLVYTYIKKRRSKMQDSTTTRIWS